MKSKLPLGQSSYFVGLKDGLNLAISFEPWQNKLRKKLGCIYIVIWETDTRASCISLSKVCLVAFGGQKPKTYSCSNHQFCRVKVRKLMMTPL